MQFQFDVQGRRGALARMVVRRRPDAAEAEHRVARGEAAFQRRREQRRLIADVLGPGKAKPPAAEGFDDEGEVLVLPFPDEDFVPDDIGTEPHAAFLAHCCSSSRPPMCLPLTKTCGTVPRPVIAPTTRERSLWSSFTSA